MLYFTFHVKFLKNLKNMPVCIECGVPITNLFTDYGKGNILLTQCVR